MATAIGDLVATMNMNVTPFQRSIATARSKMKSLGSTVVSSLKVWEKSSQRMGRTSETALERYTRRLTAAKEATLSGKRSAQQYTATIIKLKSALDRETSAEQRRNRALIRSSMASERARQAASRRRLAAAGAAFGGARRGVAIAAIPSAVIAGVAIQTARVSEGFNQAMNSSLAIMQDVNAEMRADMKRTAFEIARVTKFSGKEAAESYFFLASAGLDAKQSIAALPVVAQFAQAGMFDMAKATDLLTDAQSALGKTVKDPIKNLKNMTKLGDQLVKANTLANASVEQFSEALTNKAAASMRLLNIETAEGIAVLAAFADQGIKGSEAGTAFSIVLRDLTTKAIKQEEEFKKLGVNVFDSTGKFQGMANIVGDLEVALFGLSDEQKKATLLQLGFSDKSVQFTQVLLGMSEKIRDYTDGIRDAGGTMKDVADSQLTPFAKGMEAVGAAFSEFSVDAATGPMAELGKSMEELAKPGGDLISALNAIVDLIDEMNTSLLRAALIGVKVNRSFTLDKTKRQGADFHVAELEREIRRREEATSERLARRARGGRDIPLSEAEEQAKIFTDAQEHAIRSQRKAHQDIRKADAQAANQERAKDMEALKERQAAAGKVREGFVETPYNMFISRLAELKGLRGAPGGLTEEEYQRAVRQAQKTFMQDFKEQDKPVVTPQEAEANKIRERLRSPMDKFLDDMERVQGLVGIQGGLTEREAQMEIERLREEFAGERAGPITPTAGRIAERGTDAAFQAILTAMRDDTVDDATKETAQNTKTAAELLADIDANLAGVGIGDV